MPGSPKAIVPGFVSPRNELESQLVEVWEQVLGIRPVGVRDDFFEAGGNSWMAVKLFSKIEERLGKELPLTVLFQAGTVEQLALEIQKRDAPRPWSALVPIRTQGSQQPFFCVHGAGGHVLFIAGLARYLSPDQPVYAFQARGLQSDQEPLTHVEEMAAHYLEALRQARPHGPYLLGGYSMGGMVAFEMARQLLAHGEEVALLAIIDTPAQNPNLRYLKNFIRRAGAAVNRNLSEQEEAFLNARNYLFRLRYFLRLSLRDKAAYISDRGSAVGARIGRALMPDLLAEEPAQDADIQQFETVEPDSIRIRRLFALNETAFRLYIPERYSGSIALFQSSDGYLDVDKDYSHIPNLGWNHVIEGEIRSCIVPGNHNEIIREPNVKILAEQLRQALEEAQTHLAAEGL